MKKKLLIISFLAFTLSITATIPSPTIEVMSVVDDDTDYEILNPNTPRPKNINYNIISSE